MSGTNWSISLKAEGAGWLPSPHVRLNTNLWGSNIVQIELLKHWLNSPWGSFNLYGIPEVVAMDLTQEQIDKWVYVEVVFYKPSKNPFSQNTPRSSRYAAPSDWQWWVNPFDGNNTRGWSQYDHLWNIVAVDKPNYFKVNTKNEVIPVWKYLQYRCASYPINYFDTAWVEKQIDLITPNSYINRRSHYASKLFWYSAMYSPLYFKYRYVMFDASKKEFISWPFSSTIKMAHKVHPFRLDPIASGTYGYTCVEISPTLNATEMKCWFETRLP